MVCRQAEYSLKRSMLRLLELLSKVSSLGFSLLIVALGCACKRGDTWPHAVQMPIS